MNPNLFDKKRRVQNRYIISNDFKETNTPDSLNARVQGAHGLQNKGNKYLEFFEEDEISENEMFGSGTGKTGQTGSSRRDENGVSEIIDS
jgi:hypothetical protein